MKRVGVVVLLACLTSCTPKDPVLPAVVPVPVDDVAAYTAPVPVEPPAPLPVPVVPPVRPQVASEVRYPWEDGKADLVQVGIGYPTVVRFEPGEHISGLMDGDRAYLTEQEEPKEARVQEQVGKQNKDQQANCYWSTTWQWCRGVSEQKHVPIEHLAFTATHAGHKQGVVVFTDVRTYYLTLQAVRSTPTRLVTWTYPAPPPAPPKPREPGLFPDPGVPRTYHVGYTFTDREGVKLAPGERYDWSPVRVLSDPAGASAAKIYIEFPRALLHQRMPLLRGMNELGKPYLLNSRQSGTWVVVDELSPRLELRRGAGKDAEVVIISREQLREIGCPGDDACPRWP